MALKRKLSKTEFDALNDTLKGEYKVNPANAAEYLLDTDDATELANALDRQKAAAKTEKDRADKLQGEKDAAETARREAEEKVAREKGDVAAIEASWQKKLDDAKAGDKAVIDGLKAQLRTLLVSNVAQALAAEISTVPELLLPHIEKRLRAEEVDGNPTTRVLDVAGKPSAATLEEFKAELVANPKFAAIIIGSKANGGNSGTTQSPGNAGTSAKKIADMSDAERIALRNSLGADEFNRRATAEKAEAVVAAAAAKKK